jgi:PTH1 family peptidyl-tRNA hydrolase
MITLIVGLGNPGAKYKGTRHNVGAQFVEMLADNFKIQLKTEAKFWGQTGRVNVDGKELWLLKPNTFMNESGKSVAAFHSFYKLDALSILVVHDDLDITSGVARYKIGGGHGGHNGLRDIISSLGNESGFKRLRIGIGHPGDSSKVTNYVLNSPLSSEKEEILNICKNAIETIPLLIDDQWDKALLNLHTKKR